MFIRTAIFQRWADFRLKQLDKLLMSPKQTYEKNFRRIKKLDQTNKFAGCKQLEDLRKLPLTDYSNYQKEFTHSLQTKVNPFNGEKVFFWATSTGSSGEPKIFPITRSTKKEQTHISKFRPAQLIKKFNIYGGAPELIFVMPGESDDKYPEIPIGQIGYYHYQYSIPKQMEKYFTFTKALYKNRELFNEWHLHFALLHDCRGITTSIPVRIHHFLNQINEKKEELIQQLSNEEWPKQFGHPYLKIRQEFIIEQLKKPIINIKDLWPDLTFICLWKSGETCRRQLNELLGAYNFEGIEFIDQIYNATEGTFNIPDLYGTGGPVNIFGIILEFYHESTNQFLWPWELESGEFYEIVLTSSMGLTRYRTYDKIQCTGYSYKTAKIEFVSRTVPEISLGWAVLTEEELIQGLNKCGNVQFSELYFSLNKSGNGLELISTNPSFSKFIPQLELYLSESNPNYSAQQKKGNIVSISFKLTDKERFNEKTLQNGNTKRILLE